MTENYELQWNQFEKHVSNTFKKLRTEEYLYDVTLIGDDMVQINAHKLVMSASSEYFKNIFHQKKDIHPLICLAGLHSQQIRMILDFMYDGQVSLPHTEAEEFLEFAQKFKIEGLLAPLDREDKEIIQNNELSTKNEVLEPPSKDVDFEENQEEGMADQTVSDVSMLKNLLDVALEENVQVDEYDSKTEISDREDSSDTLSELISKKHEKEIDQKLDVESKILETKDGFQCYFCQKILPQKWRIRRHLDTHTVQEFNCYQCKKPYKNLTSYQTHIYRSHKSN